MAQDTLKQWYIAGLHAYRSASEQARQAALVAEEQGESSELKTYSREVAELSDRQESTMVAFLKELDTEPNSFKDRIQEGIIKGTEMAVKAADDASSRDVALHFGTRAGLTYFVTAFDNHKIYAKTLNMPKQAETFERLSAENRLLDERYAKLAETRLAKQAA